MAHRSIFVSCGQFTSQERELGKSIVKLIDNVPGLKAYFAEEVQDLNALDSNILAKLRSCDGFVTVLHPRGEIKKPDGSAITRASVWIEQEIAIATYIRQTEKHALPVIAFKHRAVGLEGVRGLIQLNPIEFTHENEVLVALPALLEPWRNLSLTGICAEVRTSLPMRTQDGHPIRQLLFSVVNDGGARINEISGELRIPEGILKHQSVTYAWENNLTPDRRHRVFRFDERNVGAIQPRSICSLPPFDYCKDCAIADTGEPSQAIGAMIVDDYSIEMTVWIDGRDYHVAKTIRQLLTDASGA